MMGEESNRADVGVPGTPVRPSPGIPPLRELGLDLLRLTARQKATAIALPFACAGAYFGFAAAGWWPAAISAVAALSFFTYGSTSHDLVHRTLGLPRRVNEVLLGVVELLALRSGHAYRAAHLHHHATFPDEDDIEGAAAHLSWAGALRDGLTLQFRVWWWALRRGGPDRVWVVAEGVACVLLVAWAAGLAVAGVTDVLAVHAGLVVAGSWVIPLVTSYVPHNPRGTGALRQTRVYRGLIARVVALDHLYHLEHHLYPAVPHQNWPALARRLDPYLERAGVVPVRLWF